MVDAQLSAYPLISNTKKKARPPKIAFDFWPSVHVLVPGWGGRGEPQVRPVG
jgi:hypothetical protein